MDAGSWTIDTLPSHYGLKAVWVDSDGGALVAGSFVMLRRVARGPWERVTVRGKLQHMAIAGMGSLRIAVGYPHSCVVSNDGGAKWHNRNVGSKRKLQSIACISEREIFVAGEDGSFRSSDAGKTFSRAGDMRYLALAESGLYGVSSDWKQVLHKWDGTGWASIGPMPDHSSAIAGAADVLVSVSSSVHRSVDGGATWTETLPSRDNVYLAAVATHMTGRVVVVGYRGLIAVSEDYGVTWTEHHPTDRNLQGVWIAPDEDIWAVGDDGVLVRSGIDKAGAVTVQKVEVADDGVAADAILRAASPVPAWQPPETIGAAIHTATVTAAAFLDDARAVTGDRAGRLVRLSRAADGRWHSKVRELGGAIAGLAAIGDAVFAIVDGKLAMIDGAAIETPGKVSQIAARANRLAASGPKHVTTWVVTGGRCGAPSTIEIAGEPRDLDLSLDGNLVAYVLGERVFTRDLASGKAAGEFRRKGQPHVRFTPSGKQFYLAADHYDVKLVSVAKGGGRDEIRTGNREQTIATSPRGTLAATLAYSDELSVIDATTGEVLAGWRATSEATLCGAPRPAKVSDPVLSAVAVSDAGSVVVGDITGEVAIIDAPRLALQHAESPRSARVQSPLDPPLLDIAALAYGRDGDTNHVVVLGADHRLRIIDPDSGEVRAGPSIDIANVNSLHALGDMLLAVTADGWVGLDRGTGAQRWTTRFAAREVTSYRGALYGFEHRRSHAVRTQPHYSLYRLAADTGEITEIPLETRGTTWHATPTIAGLLARFVDGDDERLAVIDPATGTVVDAPRNVTPLLVDPSKRYLLSNDGVVHDLSDPSWPIIARDVPTTVGLLLVERGVAVSIGHHMRFHDLRGAPIATLAAGSLEHNTSIFATARGEAFVTCSRWRPVRRWPVITK